MKIYKASYTQDNSAWVTKEFKSNLEAYEWCVEILKKFGDKVNRIGVVSGSRREKQYDICSENSSI
jgi:hypothetical protein